MMNIWKNYILFCFMLLLSYSFSVKNEQSSFYSCKEDQYFDIITLKCLDCPTNQTSIKSDDIYSCTCKPGFVVKYATTIEQIMACIKCPVNHTTSFDRLHCIKCAENHKYNQTFSECNECPPNMISVDHYANGSSRESRVCIECEDNYVPDENQRFCIPCHSSFYKASNGKCICSNLTHEVVQGVCISNVHRHSIPDMKNSYTVTFDGKTYESELFAKFYRMAGYSCTVLKNVSSCQLLANLCVLLFHSYDNELGPCSYYREKVLAESNRIVPVLYYEKESSYKILTNTSFDIEINLENKNYHLITAKYSFTGELLSYDSIQNVFHICPELILRLQGLKFGDTFESECRISINDILNYHSTDFFDIYLQYDNEEKTITYPVPILNLNYLHKNNKVNIENKSKWQLTQRFFLIDNISGKLKKKDGKSDQLDYIRVIKSIEVIMQLQTKTTKSKLYLPYVEISYRELSAKEFEASFIQINFKVKYDTNFIKPLKIISITIGIMCALASLLAFLKTWSASTRNGKSGIEITTIIQFICFECGYIANCFFFILFFICSVWVVIFKFQDVPWTFLPSSDEEFVITQYIISAFSLKFVHILYVICNQVNIDLFFIDWEQPKTHPTNYSLNYKDDRKKKKDVQYVSIWRTYFIANEWNELQVYRKVNLPLLLFIMIFFLNVLGYENISRASVQGASSDDVPLSQIARFSLSVITFLVIAFIQSLFTVVIYERYIEHKLQMFVDLCSMANISVLIFKYSLHGYYIHGRSVYGEADLNMRGLYDNMKREEEDLCQGRGLEPSSDCQTFEVRVTHKFRENYDSILQASEDIADQHPRNRKQATKRLERCIEAHEKMKQFLSIFLQHGLKGLDYTVKEKLFLENALDVEFQETRDKCLFFRDHCHSFDKVLACGEEVTFLTFEMMVFTFVDFLATDFILASFVTYLVYRLIQMFRSHEGKRNMIFKTLVDDRFLI